MYSKICLEQPLSNRPKIGLQDQVSLNAGQKYCRMLQGEHSALLSTFIKLPFVIKIIVLSIFEWLLYTEFTVCDQEQFISDSSVSHTYRVGWRMAGLRSRAITFKLPLQCRVFYIWILNPVEFSVIQGRTKSWAITIKVSQHGKLINTKKVVIPGFPATPLRWGRWGGVGYTGTFS